MRSLMVALLAAVMVLFTVPSASAQIDLGPSTGLIQFLGLDGEGDFTLNLCAKAVHGKCVRGALQGLGFVEGYPGFYTINGGGVTGTLTSAQNCTTCVWALTGNPLMFAFGTYPGGSDLLTATIQLISQTQTPKVNGVGFNQALADNFTVTGGELRWRWGTLGLAVQITTSKSLLTIRKGQSVFGWFDGAGSPIP